MSLSPADLRKRLGGLLAGSVDWLARRREVWERTRVKVIHVLCPLSPAADLLLWTCAFGHVLSLSLSRKLWKEPQLIYVLCLQACTRRAGSPTDPAYRLGITC